jgi:hypothetical protein
MKTRSAAWSCAQRVKSTNSFGRGIEQQVRYGKRSLVGRQESEYGDPTTYLDVLHADGALGVATAAGRVDVAQLLLLGGALCSQ